jgi:hypothetical protein
LGVLSR